MRLSEPWTVVELKGDHVVIETTLDQAVLLARGIRHFSGAAKEPNWELSVAEVMACSNVIVALEERLRNAVFAEEDEPDGSSYYEMLDAEELREMEDDG